MILRDRRARVHRQKLIAPFDAEVFGHQVDQTIELVEFGGGEAFRGHSLDVIGGCQESAIHSACGRWAVSLTGSFGHVPDPASAR